MQSRIIIDTSNKDGKILLVGAAESKTVDTSDCASIQFHTCPKMPDAITTASTARFDIIAIIPDDFDANLTSAMATLRKINPKSKIFLLAQMWQEPKAIELTTTAFNGTKLADDYYILPVRFTMKKPDGKPPVAAKPTIADIKPQPVVKPIMTEEKLSDKEIIQQQRQRIEILEKLVMEDELTGVRNRRFVREFLRQITDRASKESLQVTLLIFDIDNFKQYNDLYGHQVGDNILKQAAVLMQKCCRKQDVVGRIGGDEFAVVFWNLPVNRTLTLDTAPNSTRNLPTEAERRRLESEHPTQVINICERFRRELKKTDLPALGAEGKGTLTISGGLATFPRDGSTVDELFTQADKALLEAKRSGKNRVYLVGSENQLKQA